jgi:hypothetical protein
MFERLVARTTGSLPQQVQPAHPSQHVKALHESGHEPDTKTMVSAWDFTQVPTFGPVPPPSPPTLPSNFLPALPSQVNRVRIQAKLRVSAPDEAHEKEADRVAEQVAGDTETLVFTDKSAGVAPGASASVVTSSAAGQGSGWWDEVHRAAVDAQPLTGAHPSPTPNLLRTRLQNSVGRGAELPARNRTQMESAFRADFSQVRVHADSRAAQMSDELRAHAFTYGHDIFFASGQFAPSSTQGRRLLAHELTHVVQQRRGMGERIDRDAKPAATQVTQTFTVTVEKEMSGAEFFLRAVMQYRETGRAEAAQKIKEGKVTCSHSVCTTGVTPDMVGKPIGVSIVVGGLSTGEKAAATKRTAAIAALPPSQRKELNDEVDRRFWNKFEYKRGQALGTGTTEEGMRQAWLRTREGVLKDQESVAKIAPRIQSFLTADGKRTLRPEEYRTALRLATKLETFTEEDWQLYKRRITASTDNFEVLERAIDMFKAQQAGEKSVRDRIVGKEALYKRVKAFKAMDRSMHTPMGRGGMRQIDLPGNREKFIAERDALNADLKTAGFASIADFEAANHDYVQLFRKRAVEITMLVLRASQQAVALERRRYEDPRQNEKLFKQLAPMRAALNESTEAGRKSMPTPMQLKSDSLQQTPSQKEALSRSIESGQRADAERAKAAAEHPILKDPKLSSGVLNVESATALGEALRKNADDRLNSITKTRVSVLDDNDKVFNLDRIMDLTRQEFAVTPGSIYDLVVTDYKSDMDSDSLFISLAIGALAVGLGIVSFGTGTVAVLAGAGALGLGIYQAAEEFDKYSEGQAAAHTSFDTAMSVSSEEPSAVWVAVALIGVGLDGVALTSAFHAALPAARLLKEAGGAAKFEAELANATGLSDGVRRAIARAGKAESQYLEALDELAEARRTAPGRLHAGPDSEVVNKMVKTAYYAIKKGITDFEVFLREMKLRKLAKSIDVSSLTAEELDAFRAAFKTAGEQVAADAAKFSVKVPFKAGEKAVTFDETGKMLLDGKAVTEAKYKEIYKNLDLTHVIAGHGPKKPLIEVMNEAKNSTTGLSGRFASDERLLRAVEQAKAEWQISKKSEILLDALPNDGRAFAKVGEVPQGAQTMLPFDAPPGVVEIQVRRIKAFFQPDGSLTTIFPVGF